MKSLLPNWPSEPSELRRNVNDTFNCYQVLHKGRQVSSKEWRLARERIHRQYWEWRRTVQTDVISIDVDIPRTVPDEAIPASDLRVVVDGDKANVVSGWSSIMRNGVFVHGQEEPKPQPHGSPPKKSIIRMKDQLASKETQENCMMAFRCGPKGSAESAELPVCTPRKKANRVHYHTGEARRRLISAVEKCLEEGYDFLAGEFLLLSAQEPANARIITRVAKSFCIPRDVLKRRMTCQLGYDARPGPRVVNSPELSSVGESSGTRVEVRLTESEWREEELKRAEKVMQSYLAKKMKKAYYSRMKKFKIGRSNAAAKAFKAKPRLAAKYCKVTLKKKKAAVALRECESKYKNGALLDVQDLVALMTKLGYLTRSKVQQNVTLGILKLFNARNAKAEKEGFRINGPLTTTSATRTKTDWIQYLNALVKGKPEDTFVRADSNA